MEGYMRFLSKGPSLPGLEREEGILPYTSSLELCSLGRTRLIPVSPAQIALRGSIRRIDPDAQLRSYRAVATTLA